MYYTYEIKNKITLKRYVGSSSELEKRWQRHKRDLTNNKHHSIYLQRSYIKHGIESFDFNILEEFETKEQMLVAENLLLNSNEDLYNVSKNVSGGDLITYHPNYEEICKNRSKIYKILTIQNNRNTSDSIS